VSYLYGDSSASPLETNYIEFLRDAVDLCVELLGCDQRLQQGAARARSAEQAAANEMERLRTVTGTLTGAIAGLPVGHSDSPTARCIAAITRSAEELCATETTHVRSALASDLARLDGESGRARSAAADALGTLLGRHELPDSASAVELTAAGTTRYLARVRTATPYGVEAVLDVEIPGANLFAHPLRVDRVMDRLEIHAPEAGGWRHKEVKIRPQRLEKLHITELVVAPAESSLKLRAEADGSGGGFDLTFTHQPQQQVRLSRASGRDEPTMAPFDVGDADTTRLLIFFEKLAAAAAELRRGRRTLVEARVDGVGLASHERPALLAERLIATMAPVVKEIARRSLSPNELVLKRLVGDDRREEVFVSKAELVRRLEPLPENLRGTFAPLGLTTPPSGAGTPTPATSPASGSHGSGPVPHSPAQGPGGGSHSAGALAHSPSPGPTGSSHGHGASALPHAAASSAAVSPPTPATAPTPPHGSHSSGRVATIPPHGPPPLPRPPSSPTSSVASEPGELASSPRPLRAAAAGPGRAFDDLEPSIEEADDDSDEPTLTVPSARPNSD
jgi:hypothetical protein